MLDRFDRLWYEQRCVLILKDWRVYFTWSVLHQGVINAYVACVKHRENRELTFASFLDEVLLDARSRFPS